MKIIALPKKAKHYYNGPHLQVPLYYCMDPILDNPFLNSLYKPSVSYSERWYLELRKKISNIEYDHPLVKIVMHDIELKKNLLFSTIFDYAIMKSIVNDPQLPEFRISAGVNLKKLQRWSGFFTSLLNQADISLSLDALPLN